MGWLDRLFRGDRYGTGYGGAADGQAARAEFRASILAEGRRDAEKRREQQADIARTVNSTWQWTGESWRKWSTVWKTYDDVDQTTVPTPLLDLLGEHGVTPTAGDRFRFVDGAWHALDPGDPDDITPE